MEKIKLSDLTLKEKIGQLIIAKPKTISSDWLNLKLGGIFLDHLKNKEDYKKFVSYYKKNSKINLFVSTDMEGYWNPFRNFYASENFGELKDAKGAYLLGKEQGKILNELGFNLNFSPVVEIRNNVWEGRSFSGSVKEIKLKIIKYIHGLHSKKILATAKHYPGGSLVKNPHFFKFKVETTKEELEMFDIAIRSKVDAIMVGHPIVYGQVSSNKKQATISRELIGGLRRKFKGLIITDAVTMLGLRLSYLFNFKKVYLDLIMAGNDIILDTAASSNYNQIRGRMNGLLKAVQEGKISEKRIDESVKRILQTKGYKVI